MTKKKAQKSKIPTSAEQVYSRLIRALEARFGRDALKGSTLYGRTTVSMKISGRHYGIGFEILGAGKPPEFRPHGSGIRVCPPYRHDAHGDVRLRRRTYPFAKGSFDFDERKVVAHAENAFEALRELFRRKKAEEKAQRAKDRARKDLRAKVHALFDEMCAIRALELDVGVIDTDMARITFARKRALAYVSGNVTFHAPRAYVEALDKDDVRSLVAHADEALDEKLWREPPKAKETK